MTSLRALKEEGLIKNYGFVSLDPEKRKTKDGITIFPWKFFLENLWREKIVI